MLKGKRAVVTGGGSGFGQALVVWLAREGVEVLFSARRAQDIETTCRLVHSEGARATGYLCDTASQQSVAAFAGQIRNADLTVDILILNAAQWLSGELDEPSPTAIAATLHSGLTGSILLTQALLPALRRSRSADIVSVISACGIPGFTDSIAHPAFFASKHGLSGFTQILSHQLAKENIRVTGLYPPDFESTGFEAITDTPQEMGTHLLNGRSIWETIRFVLLQPRNCHISTIYFQGPTREDLQGQG